MQAMPAERTAPADCGGRWAWAADARALVLHALVLGLALALLFTLLAWTAGPALYRLLGGQGAALANAETYSHVLFSGSIAIWANFFLSAVLSVLVDPATTSSDLIVIRYVVRVVAPP